MLIHLVVWTLQDVKTPPQQLSTSESNTPFLYSLAPVYEELATAFAGSKSKVIIAKVDADREKDLGKRFGVQGFPTLKWFDGKSDKPEDYNGGRDLESLTAFITKKTGVHPKKAKVAPSSVEMLTDTTFKQQIGGDKDIIVAFTGMSFTHAYSSAFANLVLSSLVWTLQDVSRILSVSSPTIQAHASSSFGIERIVFDNSANFFIGLHQFGKRLQPTSRTKLMLWLLRSTLRPKTLRPQPKTKESVHTPPLNSSPRDPRRQSHTTVDDQRKILSHS